MQSSIFRLNIENVIRGAINAVVAAVIVAVAGTFAQGIDVFNTDWQAVFRLAVNSGVSAFVGYIGTKFLSDDQGKFLGSL